MATTDTPIAQARSNYLFDSHGALQAVIDDNCSGNQRERCDSRLLIDELFYEDPSDER